MDNATEFYHIRNALLEAALADYQDAAALPQRRCFPPPLPPVGKDVPPGPLCQPPPGPPGPETGSAVGPVCGHPAGGVGGDGVDGGAGGPVLPRHLEF